MSFNLQDLNRLRGLSQVIANEYKLEKQGRGFIYKKNKDVFKNKSYGINYLLTVNSNYSQNGKVIEIDAKKTYDTYGDEMYNWLVEDINEIVDAGKIHCSLPQDRSYTDAYASGIKKEYIPVLFWAEKTLNDLNSVDKSEDKDGDGELEELKAKAKELGISLRGLKTEEAIQKKIDEAESTEDETK